MKRSQVRGLAAMLAGVLLLGGISGCGASTERGSSDSGSDTATQTADVSALTFDMDAWSYDAEHDVYYQIGVVYCEKPESTDYESLGIYVPGAYLTGTENDDGTFSCTIHEDGEAAGYTATTAPVILPVDTPGYAAQAAPTEYSYNSIADYIEAGYVYLLAGMRGRSSMTGTSDALGFSGGVPYGVTDLKAAVRYYRLNAGLLPGDADRMFSYGMSGGGAQSALIGATGDSELFTPYLESIGAAMTDADGNALSDAIAGSMCWCPITSLDIADEAYEWNMGQYFDTDTRAASTYTSALSENLAEAFAEYINAMELKTSEGTVLTLTETEDGIYTAGSYYDFILSEIETSLNHFLEDTSFPYEYTETSVQVGNTAESGAGLDFGAGGMGGDDAAQPEGEDGAAEETNGGRGGRGGDGNLPELAEGEMPDFGGAGGDFGGGAPGGGMGGGFGGMGGNGGGEAVTYETAQDYIDSLNEDGTWITYDAASNTAAITSIADFVTHCKNAQKSVGAFDAMDRGQGENNVYGNGQDESRHFDAIEAALLSEHKDTYAAFADWDEAVIADFEEDLASVDGLGIDMATRVAMYNPLYYLWDYYDGSGSSTPAKYWRIRTGINQTDTALTTEENLRLVLEQNDAVESVDFATVWGQPHTTAERTGTSTENFIAWVNACVQ